MATAEIVLEPGGAARARVLLLGGVPFEEDIVMWWNFVGRGHDEIVAFREAWEAGSDQFGRIEGYRGKLYPLVITGSAMSVIPLIVLFLALQRLCAPTYWPAH